jgi:hypothetical protein
MRQDTCAKQDVQKVGATIVIDSVCKVGDATTTSHAEITGDFSSAYILKVTSKREGGRPLPGRPADGTSSMTIDAKWTGACGDLKPGDMVMAGRKMNIRDVQKMGVPGAAPKK